MVQFKFQGCITKCQKHFFIICDKFCEQCNFSLCQQCISSPDHSRHVFVNLVGKLDCKIKKKNFQRDLTDFEKHIPPKYQEIISDIQVKTCFLKENSLEIPKAINQQGEVFHREIGTAIENMKFDI